MERPDLHPYTLTVKPLWLEHQWLIYHCQLELFFSIYKNSPWIARTTPEQN